jgi:hypothetical protein
VEFTPQQEIKRKGDRSAAVEAGQGPAAMSNWPLLQFVQDLGDFDFVALLLGAVIAFFSAGFAIDYIVGRYGMGPYWNGFYAMLGAYAGLCARNWWLQQLRLRSLSDDHNHRGRIVGHRRDGERCRQTLTRAGSALSPASNGRGN